jgi:hypothetical protein
MLFAMQTRLFDDPDLVQFYDIENGWADDVLGRSPPGGEQNGLHRGVDGSGTEFLRQSIGDRVGDLFEATRCVLLDMGAQNPAVTIGDRRFLR